MEPTNEISKRHPEEKAHIDRTSLHKQLFDYTCQSNQPGVFGVPEITIHHKRNRVHSFIEIVYHHDIF